MENDKSLFYIVAIIAIVAVFGMVFMAISGNKTTRVVTTTGSELTTTDNAGQAIAPSNSGLTKQQVLQMLNRATTTILSWDAGTPISETCSQACTSRSLGTCIGAFVWNHETNNLNNDFHEPSDCALSGRYQQTSSMRTQVTCICAK